MPDAFQRVCGTCRFGHHLPKQDITKRLCFGQPPQILVLPTPPQFAKAPNGQMKMLAPGGVQLQNARPIMDANEPECSHYEPRSIGQMIADNHTEDADIMAIPPPKEDAKQ